MPIVASWRLIMSKNDNFETALLQLEQIVSKLENGNVGLEESIQLYEKGVELSNKCKVMLDNAKQKIEVIKNNNYKENEFDDNGRADEE